MQKTKILFAGESATIATTHIKGMDSFTHYSYGEAARYILPKIKENDIDVDYIPCHDVMAKFPLSVDELKEINGLSDSKIHAGQELQVSKHAEEATKSQKPKADSPKPTTEGKLKTTHHTVKPGESYYTIAEKYDCSVNDLKEWNNKSGNKIKPGDVLTIKTKKK